MYTLIYQLYKQLIVIIQIPWISLVGSCLIICYMNGEKEEKQEYAKTKATFQTLKQKWHLTATALKRTAINFDCKVPGERGYLWCHSLKEKNHSEDPKKSVLHKMQLHTGTMGHSRIRITTVGTPCHQSIRCSFPDTTGHYTIKIQVEWWLFFNFPTEISAIPPQKAVI